MDDGVEVMGEQPANFVEAARIDRVQRSPVDNPGGGAAFTFVLPVPHA